MVSAYRAEAVPGGLGAPMFADVKRELAGALGRHKGDETLKAA